jgi:DeoR/GlpR family transcriptional regulator of sugar metabolism
MLPDDHHGGQGEALPAKGKDTEQYDYRRRSRHGGRVRVGKEHRLAERRQALVVTLERAGQLSVAELSVRFDVSEVTIRQDLQALSEQGLLLRTRGGALAINVLPELSFDVRQQQYADRKARIGREAATLLQNEDTVFIDASTTAAAIIPYLRASQLTLTVLTNSLKVAMGLIGAPRVDVIMPAGRLRRESISLVRSSANDMFSEVYIRVGFFGARGFTPEQGLTEISLEEAQIKRSVTTRCQKVVGLIDARKWGQVASMAFASLDEIDAIITDEGAPEDLVEAVRRLGVDVHVV